MQLFVVLLMLDDLLHNLKQRNLMVCGFSFLGYSPFSF